MIVAEQPATSKISIGRAQRLVISSPATAHVPHAVGADGKENARGAENLDSVTVLLRSKVIAALPLAKSSNAQSRCKFYERLQQLLDSKEAFLACTPDINSSLRDKILEVIASGLSDSDAVAFHACWALFAHISLDILAPLHTSGSVSDTTLLRFLESAQMHLLKQQCLYPGRMDTLDPLAVWSACLGASKLEARHLDLSIPLLSHQTVLSSTRLRCAALALIIQIMAKDTRAVSEEHVDCTLKALKHYDAQFSTQKETIMAILTSRHRMNKSRILHTSPPPDSPHTRIDSDDEICVGPRVSLTPSRLASLQHARQ